MNHDLIPCSNDPFLTATGAVDCEIFSLGSEKKSEFFLAVANHKDRVNGMDKYDVDSVIYKFANEKFVPFQCLKTIGATHIRSFKDDFSFVLAVAHVSGVQMYQYNGWKFIPSDVQYTRGVLGPGVKSISYARIDDDRHPVLIVNNPRVNREPSVIRFDFVVENHLKEWREKSLKWCQAAKNHRLKDLIASVEEQLAQTFMVDQREPIMIKGDLIFPNGNIEIDEILSAPSVELMDGTKFNHDVIRDLDMLNTQLNSIEHQLSKVTSELTHALRLDGNQVITAPYTFTNLDMICRDGDRCSFNTIDTQILNGHDVSNLGSKVLRTDRDQFIPVDFKLDDVVISGDLLVDGLTDGVNMSHVVTKSGTHSIEGSTIFGSDVMTDSLSVFSGHMNHRLVNNRTILLKTGDQTVNSRVTFTHPVTVNNAEIGSVNHVPSFTAHINSIVTLDSDHLITGRKSFKDVYAVSSLNLQNTIGGVDVIDLWNHVLWSYGDQDVTAPCNFSRMELKGDLHVDNTINGMFIPNSDLVFMNASRAVITGEKVFASPKTIVDHMMIKDSVNGVRRVNTGYTQWNEQLDILVKSMHQTIPGTRVFNKGLHLSSHSTVQSLVDGIDLSEFSSTVLKHNSTNFLSGYWEFMGDVTFNNKVTVGGYVDGVNLTHIYKNSLKLNEKLVSNMNGPFIIENVHADHVKTNRVNGLILENDLLLKNMRQFIHAPKTFPDGIHVTKDIKILGSLNGMDVRFLKDSLMRYGDQLVWGPKIINGDLYVNNLITPVMNGIPFDQLILLNTSVPQVITGRKIFNSVSVDSDVAVNRIDVEREINSLNVNEMFKGTMLYDAPQVVTGLKHFKHIDIPKNTDLDVASVDGFSLRKAYSDAVLVDVPQIISGTKTFKGRTSFTDFWFHQMFDGVSDDDIRYNWMMQNRNEVVNGDVIFADGLSVKNNLLIMNGTINGHDIRFLNNTIVKKNEPNVIEGQITFSKPLQSTGDIWIGGKIQGIKLSQDTVSKNSDATIYGVKRFTRGLVMNESLWVHGFLDGVLISDICSNAVRTAGDQIITAPTRILNSWNVRSISTGGLVDGIDLLKFNGSVVKMSEFSIISGKKHFTNVTITAPLTLYGRFGGFDIRKLSSEYMSLSRDQVINTPLVLKNGSDFNKMIIDGNIFTKDGFINNFDIRYLDKNSLKTYGDQVVSGQVIFENEVRVLSDLIMRAPVINAIPFDHFVLKTKKQQVVSVPTQFAADVSITGNLHVADGMSLQGVDLSEMSRFRVLKSGTQVINGLKKFAHLQVDHLMVRGLMSGVNVTRDNILLSSADQTIHGNVFFARNVHLMSDLNMKHLNNINLYQWSQRLVLRGQNNTITAPKTFAGLMTASDAWTLTKIDGVNINQVKGAIYQRIDTQTLENKLNFHESKLIKIDHVLNNRGFHVHHYHLIQELKSSRLIDSSNFGSLNSVFVTSSKDSKRCDDLSFHQVSSGHPPVKYSIIRSVNPVSVVSVYSSNRQLLLIASGRLRDHRQLDSCIPLNRTQVKPVVPNGMSLIQVYSYNTTHRSYDLLNLLTTGHVTDMKVVSSSPIETCLILAIPFVQNNTQIIPGYPEVICINMNGQMVSKTLVSNGKGYNKIAVLPSNYISIIASYQTYQSSAVPIVVSSWNATIKRVTQIQSIVAYHPTVVSFATSPSSGAFLVVSEGSSSSIGNEPLLRILKMSVSNGHRFKEVQQIKMKSTVTMIDSVVMADQSLLLFNLMSDNRIVILKHTGASGFMDYREVKASGADSMRILTHHAPNGSLANHFIVTSAKSSDATSYIYEGEDDNSEGRVTQVLSSVIRPI